ncbi:MAG: arylsulfatase [Acidobacteria bacterium]|nr:arylsulfatase [Acidobacteriota bacterium]
MTRRGFLFSSLGAAAQRARPAVPNVLLVLCDDLGYGDVRVYNPSSAIRTPSLNSLAGQGMRFTDAHSPSSVCTPTRYGLLTGRYVWRTQLKNGVLGGYSPALLEPGRDTIASMLKKLGYATGGFGKWHLGLGRSPKVDYSQPFKPTPLEFGFDEFYGIPASLDMPPYVFIDGHKAVEQPTASIGDNGEVKRGPFWRGGPRAPSFQMEDVIPNIARRAIRFIEKAHAPFFAYVPLPAPHTPWVPSKPFQKRSSAGLYGDFVEETDTWIGRMLEALEQTGKARNTLVIVTSDNGAPWEDRDAAEAGGHRANANWRGQKADIFEAGHRIPFLVRWPERVKPNTVSQQTICLTDVFATIAEAAGIRLTDTMGEDSFSIVPALRGERRDVRGHIVHHAANGMFSIRAGPWKLIEGRGSGGFTEPVKLDGPGELYNLQEDPQEKRNRYDSEPRVVVRLKELLDRVRKDSRSRPRAG